MGSVRRPVGIACILCAVVLLFVNSPALAQASVTIVDSGSSDDLVPPPAPDCDDLVFLTEVTFSDQGVPLGIPRLGVGFGLVTSFVVPDFEPIGPSIIALDEVITFDGHTGRDIWPAQLNERVKFEFLLDGVVQVATPFTPDLPDDSVSAWLDVDMGTYELPNGADALRIVHFSDPNNTDSVVVSALCGTSIDLPDNTTTTTVPTTVAPCDDTASGDTDSDPAGSEPCDPPKLCDAAGDDTRTPVDPTTGEPCDPTKVDPCDDAATDGTTPVDPATGEPCDETPTTVDPNNAVQTTVAPTTVAPTTVAPTTAAPTTAPTTVAPTTVAPTTTAAPTTTEAAPTTAAETTTSAAAQSTTTTEVVDVEVEGAVEERSGDLLAATGSTTDLGFSLIAAGLVLLGSALLLQSKDPEELFAV